MTLIMLGVACASALILLLFRREKYGISWLTMLTIFIMVGLIGYFGAAFASYLSHGSWLGIRFYGWTVFATITLYILAKIVRYEPGKVMDYYAPIDIAALIIMKVNCLRAGCCSGIDLSWGTDSQSVIFPSQSIEIAVAAGLLLTIFILEKLSLRNGYLYSIYLLVYGFTRLIFEFFREEKAAVVEFGAIPVSVCHIFCAIIICFGIIGMHKARGKTNKVAAASEHTDNSKNMQN